MTPNQNLYASLSRVLHYISTSEDGQQQAYAGLKFIRDELAELSKPRELSSDAAAQMERILKREQKVRSLRDALSSRAAEEYVRGLIPDSCCSRSAAEKLSDVARELSARAKVPFDEAKCRTFLSVAKWFDDNWDAVEPFSRELVIVDCSKRAPDAQ